MAEHQLFVSLFLKCLPARHTRVPYVLVMSSPGMCQLRLGFTMIQHFIFPEFPHLCFLLISHPSGYRGRPLIPRSGNLEGTPVLLLHSTHGAQLILFPKYLHFYVLFHLQCHKLCLGLHFLLVRYLEKPPVWTYCRLTGLTSPTATLHSIS